MAQHYLTDNDVRFQRSVNRTVQNLSGGRVIPGRTVVTEGLSAVATMWVKVVTGPTGSAPVTFSCEVYASRWTESEDGETLVESVALKTGTLIIPQLADGEVIPVGTWLMATEHPTHYEAQPAVIMSTTAPSA